MKKHTRRVNTDTGVVVNMITPFWATSQRSRRNVCHKSALQIYETKNVIFLKGHRFLLGEVNTKVGFWELDIKCRIQTRGSMHEEWLGKLFCVWWTKRVSKATTCDAWISLEYEHAVMRISSFFNRSKEAYTVNAPRPAIDASQRSVTHVTAP